MMHRCTFPRALVAGEGIFTLALCLSWPAHAQIAPNAGQTLQQLQPRLQEPAPPPPALEFSAPVSQPTAPGGPTVEIKAFTLDGNSVFSTAELQALLADALDKRYDLAGLKALADRITLHYRQAGYPYAHALIPAQTLSQGRLRIQIVEGRYGKVTATGKMGKQAQPWLDELKPGAVIAQAPLERRIYELSALPGVKVSPVLGAGSHFDEGDLNVDVALDQPYGGTVTVDNFGNRYTGAYRLGANLWANSLLKFGDQLTFDGILTNESLWMGALGYTTPLGTSGLRGELRYSHTYYQLGDNFSALDANGVADTMSAGLSYPLMRTQQGSATLAVAYQHKQLLDNMGLVGTHDNTSSNSLPVSLRFDWRDRVGASWGGGTTYGALTWTPGQLDLDPSQAAFDNQTAHTAGNYSKVNLDVTRLQGLPLGLIASGRFAAQWASKNLNSSENFGLGGVNGVRAYPEGEGYGDAGWVFQGELRYKVGDFTPYVFYDIGEVKINQDPWGPGANHRALQGAGIGVRWSWNRWSAGVSAAWRVNGGPPQSDTQDPRPRIWASLSYRLF